MVHIKESFKLLLRQVIVYLDTHYTALFTLNVAKRSTLSVVQASGSFISYFLHPTPFFALRPKETYEARTFCWIIADLTGIRLMVTIIFSFMIRNKSVILGPYFDF